MVYLRQAKFLPFFEKLCRAHEILSLVQPNNRLSPPLQIGNVGNSGDLYITQDLKITIILSYHPDIERDANNQFQQ